MSNHFSSSQLTDTQAGSSIEEVRPNEYTIRAPFNLFLNTQTVNRLLRTYLLVAITYTAVAYFRQAIARAFSIVSRTSAKTANVVTLTVFTILTWQPTIILAAFFLAFVPEVNEFFQHTLPDFFWAQPWSFVFWVLIIFKFSKVVIHLISYITYRPVPLPAHPTLSRSDVSVIIPTVGDVSETQFHHEFEECLKTILLNRPLEIIISTVGDQKRQQLVAFCQEALQRFRAEPDFADVNTTIRVISIDVPDKRQQLLAGVQLVGTRITAYADDHVYWPRTFLEHTLAAFEDDLVGLVGTVKRVRRERGNTLLDSLMNYLALMYLERHNYECTATNNIDGGVFVISGRTAMTRTRIIQSAAFRNGFTSESWLGAGPMKVDDDNFITRFMVNHGYKTVFQNCPEARMETVLGVSGPRKLQGQMIRWARTTVRSNAVSLLIDRTCWRAHPWTTWGMFITSYLNNALIYDSLLFYTFKKSDMSFPLLYLVAAVYGSKLIKPFGHLCREPRDVFFVLFNVFVFSYVHSLLKIWAFLTPRNIAWTGRKGIDAAGGAAAPAVNT
ncbi:hypothetical protein BP6252_11716 [Coleophoma cylindrospora]|uniref:Glycosyltransferase family 2 protein n=1 Tax=Coleophoma cylindrospora TaxID=1849047 RepID=A0A3D8QKD3_9HELO|nr:hypothetical protein BP6252_11716 [Coleophoma cylindrospora]